MSIRFRPLIDYSYDFMAYNFWDNMYGECYNASTF